MLCPNCGSLQANDVQNCTICGFQFILTEVKLEFKPAVNKFNYKTILIYILFICIIFYIFSFFIDNIFYIIARLTSNGFNKIIFYTFIFFNSDEYPDWAIYRIIFRVFYIVLFGILWVGCLKNIKLTYIITIIIGLSGLINLFDGFNAELLFNLAFNLSIAYLAWKILKQNF